MSITRNGCSAPAAGDKHMVEVGSVIRAAVVRVEAHGVYLQFGEETVLVLAPEVAWLAKGDLRSRVQVGELFDILVLRYNYQTGEIVGSIRRLHPEQNPYRQLSRLEPGEVFRGKVTAVYADGATVYLANGARGNIPAPQLPRRKLQPGEEVEVIIAALEVDEGQLTLALVPRRTEPVERPAGPALAGTPA